ncbi:hypothetical protein PSTT_09146, partial [Puccinia striiformis]
MDPISSSQNAISKEAIPEHVQIINICEYINCHELSPKKKNLAFLKNKNDTLVNRQSKWPSSGLHLTMELVDELVTLVTRSQEGHEKWENWVLREAVNILDRQKPDSGYYPNGLYQRSTTVTAKFLNDRPHALEEETGELNKNLDDNEAEGLDMEAIGYKQLPSSQLRARDRFNRIARLVCGMIAYARNCCHNGMQLRTAIQLVACGVTDRVNHYLMYHSLVCGQQTAIVELYHWIVLQPVLYSGGTSRSVAKSGAEVFTQTHKNIMLPIALNVVLQMTNSYDIFDCKKEKPTCKEMKLEDSFVKGFG